MLRFTPGVPAFSVDFASAQAFLSMPESLASARAAEELAREARDEPARAKALRVLGHAYERAGDRTAALRVYEESTVISRAIGDRLGEASGLNNQGIIAGQTGNG